MNQANPAPATTPWPMTVKRIYGYSAIAIAEGDRDTVRLVQYRNEAGKHEGEVAVFMGEHAEGNANLFVAATGMLAACELVESNLAFFEGSDIPAHAGYGAERVVAINVADFAAMLASVRAGIDKAKGGTTR